MKITKEELAEVLRLHNMWLMVETGGARADLSDADLSYAKLSYAKLSRADLSYADLSYADLSDAKMPGLPNKPVPASLQEAAKATMDWLTAERWIRATWIETPTGAYAGDCRACLHGAAIYIGGPEYGPKLSNALTEAGHGWDWNDEMGRTHEDVMQALVEIAA